MAWSDFFNNMREALHKAEQEQKASAQSGANTSLNDILRPNIQRPEITYGAHSAERNTPKKKTYQQVWGFEQDKANYGNERNGDNLIWRKLTVLNNDTGDKVKFDIGYDTDGRISGVRDYKPDGTTMGYYGKDLVSNFFINNFDRDATDYTIYDVDESWTSGGSGGSGRYSALYDSERDEAQGGFIPSIALSNKPSSIVLDRRLDRNLDEPAPSYSDTMLYRMLNGKQDEDFVAANRGSLKDVQPRETLSDSVYFTAPLNEVADVAANKDALLQLAEEWLNEPDYDKRRAIVSNYRKKYGWDRKNMWNDDGSPILLEEILTPFSPLNDEKGDDYDARKKTLDIFFYPNLRWAMKKIDRA